MDINGKPAAAVKLYCSLRETGCPGFIEKDILIYLLEPDELYFWGACGECGATGSLIVSLIELLSGCPSGAVM
jgi:hypothetical protein